MAKQGAKKSKRFYGKESTDIRRCENRRRRAVVKQLLRECRRDSETDIILPRFLSTCGWLTW